MNMFVGNLSFESKEEDVRKLFAGFGSVASVSIVMDKKGTKSRGFGFVEMPGEEEARAAIAALNGKEFMGRPINVEESRSKPQSGRDLRQKEKKQQVLEAAPKVRAPFKKGFPISGSRYKEGRRTRSFLRKRSEAGIGEPVMQEKKNKENPMRWRKKPRFSKPWQKKGEEAKPWEQKREGGSKPWQKKGEGVKPWEQKKEAPKPWEQKREVGHKPWQKKEEGTKPWEQKREAPKPWERKRQEAKLRDASTGDSGPKRKGRGNSRPWERGAGERRTGRHKR